MSLLVCPFHPWPWSWVRFLLWSLVFFWEKTSFTLMPSRTGVLRCPLDCPSVGPGVLLLIPASLVTRAQVCARNSPDNTYVLGIWGPRSLPGLVATSGPYVKTLLPYFEPLELSRQELGFYYLNKYPLRHLMQFFQPLLCLSVHVSREHSPYSPFILCFCD